ncbi:heme utilization protein [Pseudomonas juntendi]|uniref:heme utilization protein n=1 Tax=Pseudomonas juntendi TaxID=2666183 RepID=UPI0018D75294|nr:heme utilization protein [Pseudomonas juntendi]MBH3371762.1 heme utilization protein [Pseudomonas juntendi]
MKPSMAIKPLVFAIAAVMAVAVQAGQNDRRGDYHNGNNNGQHTPPATKIPVYATANAWDTQTSTNNRITNQGTINEAEISDSGTGSSGNVGINVAAGNGNQQDNAAAIANAGSESSLDNSFVFGMANATADVVQTSRSNRVDNYSTQSSALMSGSASGAEGNIGINVAGGDLNQQKNTMAIANTGAPLGNATATASANQSGPGLTVNNGADRTYRVDTLTFTTSASGSSSRDGTFNSSDDRSASSSFSVAGSQSASNSGSSGWNSSGSSSANASGSNSASASGSNSWGMNGSASGSNSSSSSASLNASLAAAADATRTVTTDDGRRERSRTSSFDGSLNASLNASIDKSHESAYDSSFEKAFDSNYDKSHQSSYDKSRDSSYTKSHESSYENASASDFSKSGEQSHQSSNDVAKSYSESSAYDLSNTVSFQVLTPTGWANPVTNTATLSGSVNGGSGNLGVNVAAGVGNQQSNSLAISNTSF